MTTRMVETKRNEDLDIDSVYGALENKVDTIKNVLNRQGLRANGGLNNLIEALKNSTIDQKPHKYWLELDRCAPGEIATKYMHVISGDKKRYLFAQISKTRSPGYYSFTFLIDGLTGTLIEKCILNAGSYIRSYIIIFDKGDRGDDFYFIVGSKLYLFNSATGTKSLISETHICDFELLSIGVECNGELYGEVFVKTYSNSHGSETMRCFNLKTKTTTDFETGIRYLRGSQLFRYSDTDILITHFDEKSWHVLDCKSKKVTKEIDITFLKSWGKKNGFEMDGTCVYWGSERYNITVISDDVFILNISNREKSFMLKVNHKNKTIEVISEDTCEDEQIDFYDKASNTTYELTTLKRTWWHDKCKIRIQKNVHSYEDYLKINAK